LAKPACRQNRLKGGIERIAEVALPYTQGKDYGNYGRKTRYKV
jgi:hypothetical protein